MLFRSRGWLCIATICKALAQTAGGQAAAAFPAPSGVHPLSEADAWKAEDPARQQPQPEIINTRVGDYAQKEYNYTTP
jgi:hypothetical protein